MEQMLLLMQVKEMQMKAALQARLQQKKARKHALYNPASRSRPEHLKRACDILLRFLPENRLCGIARNIGRAGESCRMLTLGELREAEVDMFCTVLIGNAMTKTIGGRLITPRGYKNV